MRIAKNKVVSIDYILTDQHGKVIDRSSAEDPLTFIQGIGNLIPGLEIALEGKSAGESFKVAISPDEAYGERDETLQQAVPRELFDSPEELQVGMRFQADSPAGMQVVTIVDVNGDNITVDANHPLAGETLNFDVTVVDIRDASEEELSHGHVHGPHTHE